MRLIPVTDPLEISMVRKALAQKNQPQSLRSKERLIPVTDPKELAVVRKAFGMSPINPEPSTFDKLSQFAKSHSPFGFLLNKNSNEAPIYQVADSVNAIGEGVRDAIANPIMGAFGYHNNLPRMAPGSGYEAERFIGGAIPAVIAGEFAAPLGIAMKGAPFLSTAAKYLSGTIPRNAARRALLSAGYLAASNPDNRAKSALTGGALSLGFEPINAALPIAISSGRKGLKYLFESGKSTAKNMRDLLKNPESLNLSVADIAGNQGAQRAISENLTGLPFSGVTKSMRESVEDLSAKANSFGEGLRGGLDPALIDSHIGDKIVKNHEKYNKITKDLYQYIHDNGASYKIPIRENINSVAKSYLNQHKNAIKGGDPSALTNRAAEILENIVGPISKDYSISQAVNARTQYSALAQKAYNKGNNYEGKMYASLKSAQDKDISSAVQKTGRQDLISAHEKALKNHQVNVEPYRKGNLIGRLTNNNDEVSNIHNLLKKPDYKTVLNHLSAEDRKRVAYGALSKTQDTLAEDEFNFSAPKIVNTYRKLTPAQRKALFSDKERKDIADIERLVEANKENMIKLNTPPTGARTAQALKALTPLGVAALGNHLFPGHPYLNAMASLASMGAGGSVNRALRSPALKEELLAIAENRAPKAAFVQGRKRMDTAANILRGLTLPFAGGN